MDRRLAPFWTVFFLACGGDGAVVPRESGAAPALESRPRAEASGPTVVFLGDSLTAGLGLDEDQAHPAVVAALLRAEGLEARIVNAGVSGDTTAGGLARLDWLLGQEPEVVVVSLGANDGLRGLPVAETEANLRRIVERAQEAGARVLLTGMRMPTNYGPEYTADFAALFPRIAREMDVPLVPFLLEGVAAREELNLADGVHPNAHGQRRIAETVLEHLRPLVEAAQEPASARTPTSVPTTSSTPPT